MNEIPRDNVAGPEPAPTMRTRDELKAVLDIALPQSPDQFCERLIKEKWGQDIDPATALLVTLDYDYKGHPAQNGIHQGQVAKSMSLVQALLSNHQIVGDGRFGETAFGFYTPPDVGPSIRIVENVDEFADAGNGNHDSYEGIYRRTFVQRYEPSTQIAVRPADFKKWVWELGLQDRYQAYLDQAWPADEVIVAASPHALKTSAKAAFVMAAFLQRHESSMSPKGLELALQAARLPPDQTWATLTIKLLQAPFRLPTKLKTGRLKLYRYTSKDIWGWRDSDGAIVLYIPGNSSPLHAFSDSGQLHQWVVEQGRSEVTKQALATHFAEDDRKDGTFHAGVLAALDGMSVYPKEHWLTLEAGFFNNDGFWDPAQYIDFDDSPLDIDPFAQLVLIMKEASRASVKTIRDDAQVNRDNLSAVVEPIVQWVNRFGPLALFVPGGEGLLALAGIIDAGYGVDQAINGETSNDRSAGVTRTVFGLLNALPLVGAAAVVRGESVEVAAIEERVREPGAIPKDEVVRSAPNQGVAPLAPLSRLALIRGIGPSVASFSDDLLVQIGKVSAIDNDMLRLMQAGRTPTPLLTDTIDRFRIDQEIAALADPSTAPAELFNDRYQALQQTEHQWVRLFQRQYPNLPRTAVEQMLDRYGVDFTATPELAEARKLFKQLDSKARQYQQHVRLNRAYEGLFLRSVVSSESDTLALHSLKNLPGWPKGLRVEVLDGSIAGRVLDRSGPLDAPECRRLIKVGARYQHQGLSNATANFYDALVGVLSEDERSVLQLLSSDPGAELKLNISDHALSRSELVLGLGRKDSGLPFQGQGLRGGSVGSSQAATLVLDTLRLQYKEFYPEFSDADANQMMQRLGSRAQAYLDGQKLQLQQLHADLETWFDQVGVDIDDMDIDFLQMGDPGTEGLTHLQIGMHNAELLQDTMAYEREIRGELGDELIAILQKRAPQQNSKYSGDHVVGFTINMGYEDFHRLPALNARFNDVVELKLNNFHLVERETLDGFLQCFPDLCSLNLEETDLRLANTDGQLESVLPPTIPQLQHLVSLNLRSTHLTFEEDTAAQLSQLVNLQTLDLSNNPLGVPPVVLGMNQLRTLRLNDTGISTCPVGVMNQPYMTLLDLRNNQIRRVPQAILDQAISRDRVLLWNNPLTDEDTLLRLVTHREQTGINLWLSAPGTDYSDPAAWLNGVEVAQRSARLEVWQRLALRQAGGRFLGTMNTLTLTADFRVNYLDLQARVWRLLTDADASNELWGRLQNAPMPVGALDNPFAVFTALETRAQLYRDWVAVGQPIPIWR